MVHVTYYLHLLACINLVASEATTYIALPAESYAVTIKDPPTPADDEIIVQTDSASGDVNIFPGKKRQEAFTKALEDCGDKDDKCFEKLSQAWGYGDRPESDAETGLSKRVVSLIAGAAIAGVAILMEAWVIQNSESKQNAFRLPGPEVSKIMEAPAETTIFQTATDDPKPVTVIQTPASIPTGDVPSIKQDKDKNLEITIPEDEIKDINKAVNDVICKRQEGQDPNDDAMRACIEHAAESVARYSEVGAYLRSYKGLTWEGDADIPLPRGWDAVPLELERTIKLLQFGSLSPTLRNALGRFSMLLAWFRYEGGGEITGKFSIPFDQLHEDKDDETKTCEAGKMTFFCEECGGPDKLIPGTPWKDAPKQYQGDNAKLWTCAGREDDDKRKSCPCMQVIWPEGFEIETNTEGLPEPPKNGNGGNSNSGDDELTCRKGNKDLRADPKQWKWAPREQMHNRVDEFCDKFGEDVKDVMYGPGPNKEDDYDDLQWNAFRFEVKFTEKPSPEECKNGLRRAIDGCDKDATLNEHDYVWGALFREKGRSYEVIPTRDRVVDKAIEWECNIWAKREDKGNKGMNGVELPDETEDKMMKLMHVHFIKDFGWAGDGLDLGPVEGKGPFYKTTMQASRSYYSNHECWDYNYGCIQDAILQGGVVMTGTHWAGSSGGIKNYAGSRCWLGFDDY